MKKGIALGVFVLVAAVVSAQTLPLPVKVGIDPPAAGDPAAPLGYTVQLDAQPAVDVGMPATVASCKDFVGGKLGPCLPFTVSVPTAGAHTVTIVGYNLAGQSSTPAVIPVPVGPAPGPPGGLRIVK